jgi:L-cysteine S-thiosulfotransferase
MKVQPAAAMFFAVFAASALGGVEAYAQPGGQPAEAAAPLQVAVPGEEFLPAAVRAKQQDDFDNPAFPFVQAGEAAWGKAEGEKGKACKDCHGAPPEQRVTSAVASYPSYARDAKQILTLPARINFCRKNALRAPELAEGSDQMMAMTAYLRWTVRGRAPTADVTGPAEAVLEKGKELYFKKIGQLQYSCADCHNQNFGQKFGGETLSQGHAVAYPVFSLGQKRMISLDERFRMCNRLARAEPQAEGSPDYVALELYLNWRSKDLPITAPGVRP